VAGLIGFDVITNVFSGLGSAELDWGCILAKKKLIDLVVISLWRGGHYLLLNNN